MTKSGKIELMSPAGDFTAMQAALALSKSTLMIDKSWS